MNTAISRSTNRAGALLLLATLLIPGAVRSAGLELLPGEHICLVGNALGERMQHHNWWETMLHTRFAEQRVVVRREHIEVGRAATPTDPCGSRNGPIRRI